MNGIPRPIVLGEPLINRLFGRTVLLRNLLATSYLVRRLRPYYDLVIETQSGTPLRWADATYVQFPLLVYILKFYLEHQYTLRLYERAYNSLAI